MVPSPSLYVLDGYTMSKILQRLTEALSSVITTEDMRKLEIEIQETNEYLRQLIDLQKALEMICSKKKDKKHRDKEDKNGSLRRAIVETTPPPIYTEPHPFDGYSISYAIAELLQTVGPRHSEAIAKATAESVDVIAMELMKYPDLFEKETDGWHLTSKAMSYLKGDDE